MEKIWKEFSIETEWRESFHKKRSRLKIGVQTREEKAGNKSFRPVLSTYPTVWKARCYERHNVWKELVWNPFPWVRNKTKTQVSYRGTNYLGENELCIDTEYERNMCPRESGRLVPSRRFIYTHLEQQCLLLKSKTWGYLMGFFSEFVLSVRYTFLNPYSLNSQKEK